VIIFAMMNQGVGILPNSGELVVFLAGIGLTVGFKTIDGMKSSVDTFLFPVGFFIALFVETVYLAYYELGGQIWLGVAAFGMFFLFSGLLVYSDQMKESEKLEEVVRFISNRLSWGLVGFYISSTFLRPALALLLSDWQSGSLDATVASTALVLCVAVVGMFAITLGMFDERGFIRQRLQWGQTSSTVEPD